MNLQPMTLDLIDCKFDIFIKSDIDQFSKQNLSQEENIWYSNLKEILDVD